MNEGNYSYMRSNNRANGDVERAKNYRRDATSVDMDLVDSDDQSGAQNINQRKSKGPVNAPVPNQDFRQNQDASLGGNPNGSKPKAKKGNLDPEKKAKRSSFHHSFVNKLKKLSVIFTDNKRTSVKEPNNNVRDQMPEGSFKIVKCYYCQGNVCFPEGISLAKCKMCGKDNQQSIGTLIVGVLTGHALAGPGYYPYCRMMMGSQGARTKIAEDPKFATWEEEFAFRITDPKQVVDLSIFLATGGRGNSNDPILGKITIPLNTLMPKEKKKHLFGLYFDSETGMLIGCKESPQKLREQLYRRRSFIAAHSGELPNMPPKNSNEPSILLDICVQPAKEYVELFEKNWLASQESEMARNVPKSSIPIKFIISRDQLDPLNMIFVPIDQNQNVVQVISQIYDSMQPELKRRVAGPHELRLTEVVEGTERIMDPKELPLMGFMTLRNEKDVNVFYCIRSMATCLEDKLDVKKDPSVVDRASSSEKRRSYNALKRRSANLDNLNLPPAESTVAGLKDFQNMRLDINPNSLGESFEVSNIGLLMDRSDLEALAFEEEQPTRPTSILKTNNNSSSGMKKSVSFEVVSSRQSQSVVVKKVLHPVAVPIPTMVSAMNNSAPQTAASSSNQKEIELVNRQKEIELANRQKEIELANKRKEFEIVNRKKELELLNRQREIESASKQNETEVKNMEAQLKTKDAIINTLKEQLDYLKTFKTGSIVAVFDAMQTWFDSLTKQTEINWVAESAQLSSFIVQMGTIQDSTNAIVQQHEHLRKTCEEQDSLIKTKEAQLVLFKQKLQNYTKSISSKLSHLAEMEAENESLKLLVQELQKKNEKSIIPSPSQNSPEEMVPMITSIKTMDMAPKKLQVVSFNNIKSVALLPKKIPIKRTSWSNAALSHDNFSKLDDSNRIYCLEDLFMKNISCPQGDPLVVVPDYDDKDYLEYEKQLEISLLKHSSWNDLPLLPQKSGEVNEFNALENLVTQTHHTQPLVVPPDFIDEDYQDYEKQIEQNYNKNRSSWAEMNVMPKQNVEEAYSPATLEELSLQDNEPYPLVVVPDPTDPETIELIDQSEHRLPDSPGSDDTLLDRPGMPRVPSTDVLLRQDEEFQNLVDEITPFFSGASMPEEVNFRSYGPSGSNSENSIDEEAFETEQQIQEDVQSPQSLDVYAGFPETPKKATDQSKHVLFHPSILFLDAALEGNLEEIVSIQKQFSLDVNITNEDGITALHCAACNGHVEVAEWLLNNGANVNACDLDGWAPLHGAACLGDGNIIQLLYLHGANVEAKTEEQEIPGDLAENIEAYTLLQEYREKKFSSPCVTVLFDFDPSKEQDMEGNELLIARGDLLQVISRSEDGWWHVENDRGLKGYVPSTFVQ